jgi:hypothetical protein
VVGGSERRWRGFQHPLWPPIPFSHVSFLADKFSLSDRTRNSAKHEKTGRKPLILDILRDNSFRINGLQAMIEGTSD